MYAPILEPERSEYVFTNQSFVIPISFLAKPMPDMEDITWQVQDMDFGHIMHPSDVSFLFLKKVNKFHLRFCHHFLSILGRIRIDCIGSYDFK